MIPLQRIYTGNCVESLAYRGQQSGMSINQKGLQEKEISKYYGISISSVIMRLKHEGQTLSWEMKI